MRSYPTRLRDLTLKLTLLLALLLTQASAASAAVPDQAPPDPATGPEPTVAQRLRQARALLETAPELALRLATQAEAQARTQADARGRLRSLSLMATAAAFSNDPASALRYDYQQLALARQLGDSSAAATACNNLTSTLIDRRDTTLAQAVLRQGLALVPHGTAGLVARGTLLNSVATMSFNAGHYERAIFEARQALRLLPAEPDSTSGWVVSSLQGLLGACYAALGQPEQAEQLLSQQLALDRRQHHDRQVAQNLVALAGSLLSRDHPGGLDTLGVALRLARRLQAAPRVLECYEEYRTYYSQCGRYRLAYEWSRRVQQFNDSLNDLRQRQALVAANSYYAAQARETQIRDLGEHAALQRARTRLLLAIVAGLVLTLAGAVVLLGKLRRRDHQLARQHLALRQATAEAQRQAAANDRLYALVAHDLRGPVASFTSLSQLIELYLQQQDRAGLSQLNTLVRQSARQLSELLHNLLGWTLTQTGETPFDPRPLAVGPLLAEVGAVYAGQAQARQVRLVIESPPPGLRVHADPQMLGTMLRNLVGNALRYADPDGGWVRVSAAAEPTARPDFETKPATVRITVADNGPGMSASQIATLLRADQHGLPPPPPRPDDVRAGTGLGLALCLAFARQHGGQLRIESQPGQGTQVHVLLPTTARMEPTAAQREQTAEEPPEAVLESRRR